MKLLLRSLPATIDGGNEKHSVHYKNNRNLKTRMALDKRKYIQFNTEEKTSLMIFDFDYIDGKTAVEVFSLESFIHYVYEKIGMVPTYCCQTTRGFQFAFHLYKRVLTENKKSYDYLKAIKEAVTRVLGCDKMASHRLHGVWRNPLKHPFHFSGVIDYELNQFKHLLEKKKPVARVSNNLAKKTWGTIPTSALVEGQRHAKLYLMAVTYAYYAEGLLLEELQTYLHRQNALAQPPLTDKEVDSIASNVYKKKIEGTLYIAQQHLKDVNLGIMQFKKMRNLSREEYEAETKRRQSLSAERTNKIKRKKNRKDILSKIAKAIKTLILLNKDVTILGIAKLSGLSRNTIKSYWNKNNL